ncbi:MAG: hypothetical protein J7F05_00300, partial [Trichodesmium erythraeum GBRTRLIN201]|nr:hypothetical protein [Trichodesmium erythraeum GBRTRLIN201]
MRENTLSEATQIQFKTIGHSNTTIEWIKSHNLCLNWWKQSIDDYRVIILTQTAYSGVTDPLYPVSLTPTDEALLVRIKDLLITEHF